MKETEKVKIRELLYNNYEFNECILEEVNWLKYGSSIEFRLNYIFTDSKGFYIDSSGKHCIKTGKHRENIDIPFIKTIRFNLVQEFLLKNFLPIDNKEEISNINWGFSEIDVLRIEDNEVFLSYYRKEEIKYHHFTVFFDGGRRIDIVCNELEILE